MDEVFDHVVIGSGPSAVASIAVLIEKGFHPLVIDVGFRSHPQIGESHSSLKTWFGSDATYRQPSFSTGFFDRKIKIRPSFGYGGFSRVWGATCNFDYDFSDWAKLTQPIEADFEIVRNLLEPHKFDISIENSSKALLNLLSKLRTELFEVIEPTLAINTNENSPTKCLNSAECLSGCRSNSIWYAGDQVDQWIAASLMTYKSNLFVEKLGLLDGKIEIHVKNKESEFFIHAKKAFIATGVLSTARILISSGVLKEITIKETPTHFLAAIAKNSNYVPKELVNTLSKAWIQGKGQNEVLVQIYNAGVGNKSRLMNSLPKFARNDKLISILSRYLIPMIVYTREHKAVHVTRDPKNGEVVFKPILEKSRRLHFRNVLRQFRVPFLRSGALLINHRFFYSKEVLSGYHFGSSVPHGEISDSLGQVEGLKHVHIIDASVLPNLLPGSIVPVTMINAVRITREVLSEF